MPDPFTLLGVEPRYDLDLVSLGRQHRELSRALHPDRYAARSPAERRVALGRAIEVNQAWRALRDPVARAEALLETLGIAPSETGVPPAEPSFLAEIMEQREELAEARAARDLERVRRLARSALAEEQALEAELGRQFAELGSRPEQAGVAEVQRTLAKVRYFQRFLEDSSSIEDDLL
jgi:molecular chaperone HscB